MNRFWLAQRSHTAGVQALNKFRNLTNYRDILRPYEMGTRAYSKVNIKYFNPLAYDSITKIALF